MTAAVICIMRVEDDGTVSTVAWDINDPDDAQAEFVERLGDPDASSLCISLETVVKLADPYVIASERS